MRPMLWPLPSLLLTIYNMTIKKLKIVSISSEIYPFSKTGGLADVAAFLPKALKKLGQDVICITPLYAKIIDKKKNKLELVYENVDVHLNSTESAKVNYWKGYSKAKVPIYFIENTKYFSRRKDLYGSGHENARFLVFDVAALKLISLLKFEADIIHCHDWQTGLIPFYLKTDFRYSKTLKNAKTIFTIHNLIFQFGKNWWEVSPKKKDYGRSRIPHLADPRIEYINFAKRAILSADAINTVSETYREEIMTKNFGQDLHQILKNRKDRLFGIVNGISYRDWNPANDPGLYKNYSASSISKKKENKKNLQKKLGLEVNEKIPIICFTSRMTYQKGLDLIVEILDQLMMMDLQIILVGDCKEPYVSKIKKIAKKNPKKIFFGPTHEDCMKYETQAYSASDFFLMPSHYEPCGVNQLIAMRYGCVPIVRKVGGLDDTVDNYNPKTKKGTGFVFDKFDKFHLFGAITRALENYFHQDESWSNLVKRVMQQSYDWEIPAKKYIKLYKNLKKMNGNGKSNGKKIK